MIGLAQALGSVSELPVMALSPLLLRRWSAPQLLAGSGLLFAFRSGIYVLAPAPGWALAAQALHGLCFSLLWTAGVVEAQRLAPRGLETTAQSLFGTTVFGVASALASAGGGVLYREVGYAALFAAGGAAALLGAAGLLIGLRNRRASGVEPASPD